LNETPKAFANFSPGLELATTLGDRSDIKAKTLKGLGSWRTLSGLNPFYLSHTQGSRSSNPWAEISERLRRFIQFQTRALLLPSRGDKLTESWYSRFSIISSLNHSRHQDLRLTSSSLCRLFVFSNLTMPRILMRISTNHISIEHAKIRTRTKAVGGANK